MMMMMIMIQLLPGLGSLKRRWGAELNRAGEEGGGGGGRRRRRRRRRSMSSCSDFLVSLESKKQFAICQQKYFYISTRHI